MAENGKQIKLYGRRQIILVVSAVCVSTGLMFPLMYSLKGSLGIAEVGAMVLALVMCLSVVGFMVWYGNKPEKGTSAGSAPEHSASREKQEKMELWNRKFGKLMKVLFWFLLLLGILRLCMGFFG